MRFSCVRWWAVVCRCFVYLAPFNPFGIHLCGCFQEQSLSLQHLAYPFYKLFAIGLPFTYEIMLNHAFASSITPNRAFLCALIIRFARWCLLLPYNCDEQCVVEFILLKRKLIVRMLNVARWVWERTLKQMNEQKGGLQCRWLMNMINVNERHIMSACQNLLSLSLLIRYVQHQNGKSVIYEIGMDYSLCYRKRVARSL